MTKETIEIIRSLPHEFVRDGTEIGAYPQPNDPKQTTWFAVNPSVRPWKSYDNGATWTPVEWKQIPDTETNE